MFVTIWSMWSEVKWMKKIWILISFDNFISLTLRKSDQIMWPFQMYLCKMMFLLSFKLVIYILRKFLFSKMFFLKSTFLGFCRRHSPWPMRLRQILVWAAASSNRNDLHKCSQPRNSQRPGHLSNFLLHFSQVNRFVKEKRFV